VIHEVRETINTGDTVAAGTNGSLIIQKRINLQHGMRHTINHCDFFDDGNFLGALTAPALNFAYEFYVTNYPIIPQDVQLPGISATNFGPQAGDDQVLFKVRKYSGGLGGQTVETFPNTFLGSSPTFSFYTPQLYLTMIAGGEDIEDFSDFVYMSWYAALEAVEVDAVEYGIGMLREHADNQWRTLNSNGIVIDAVEIEGAQPMWQIGGIRPEIMSRPTGLGAAEGWFFGLAGYGDSEAMATATSIRFGLGQSRTMVGHTDAFGDAQLDIPDWFKAIAAPFPEFQTGPVRANFPPIVKNNNGNGEMV